MQLVATGIFLFAVAMLFARGVRLANTDIIERRALFAELQDKVCIVHASRGGARVRVVTPRTVTVVGLGRMTVTLENLAGERRNIQLADVYRVTRPDGEVLGDWTTKKNSDAVGSEES